MFDGIPYHDDPLFFPFWGLAALLFLYWMVPPAATLLGLSRSRIRLSDEPAPLADSHFPIRLKLHEELVELGFTPVGTVQVRYFLFYYYWAMTHGIRVYRSDAIPCFVLVFPNLFNHEVPSAVFVTALEDGRELRT